MSAGQRSDIQINPDIPEAQALKQWYDFEGRTASTQHAGEGLATARSAAILGPAVDTCHRSCQGNMAMLLGVNNRDLLFAVAPGVMPSGNNGHACRRELIVACG